MMIYVIRNNQQFGPYDEQTILSYVNTGQILLCDEVVYEGISKTYTVREVLKNAHLKPHVQRSDNLFKQLKGIGSTLILPREAFERRTYTSDKRLLMLALVGLLPLILGTVLSSFGWLMFYVISLYFASVWGLFFYYMFKTPQVKLKTTIILFFTTQIVIFLIFGLGINQLNPFYWLDSENIFFRLFFFVFAVGVTEEFAKSVPLYIVERITKTPLVPQTMVFYGLMSGIAFGVYEGVQYQMTVNATLAYNESFMLNIARLTSLPFLHAVWCGIAGYFISFAALYPRYRFSLRLLALAIPALLHGLYDTFCGASFIGLIVSIFLSFVAVGLLVVYLKQGVNMQSKLKN